MSHSCKKYENVSGVPITLSIKRLLEEVTEYKISFQKNDSKGRKLKWLIIATIINIAAIIFVDLSFNVLLIIFSTFGFLMIFWLTHSVQSESLLIVPRECIQSTIKYVCGQEHKSIPWNNIDDVIINEVIQMQYVMYYLTIITKEEDKTNIIPLFTCTKPRLNILENVYTDIQNILRKNIAQNSGGGDK